MTAVDLPPPQYRRSGSLIQFVLPVFNETEGLRAFHDTLNHALEERPDLRFGFLYVDDGSTDDSLDQLLRLRDMDSRVTVISLSRNFGHQIAITAGLDASDADAVIVMDTDLQDPPAVCLQLIDRWEHGSDVVYAQRRTRHDSALKRSSAWLFYLVLDRLSATRIPRNVGDFRIMDRRVVLEVIRYREHARFVRGIVAHVGFRQEALPFDRGERAAGSTGYPLRSMVKLASDGIFGFSTVPLRAISRLGVLVSVLSLVAAAYVLWVRLFEPERSVPGWAFLGTGLFLLGGVQLIMLGVLGSYLGRVYQETQGRPLYSVGLATRSPQRHLFATVPAIRSSRRTAQGTALPRLGEALVEAGLVSPRDVTDALALQRRHGGRLGDHLMALTALPSHKMWEALADQWDAPLLDLILEPADPSLLEGSDRFRHRGWIPWRRVEDGIVIASSVPPTPRLISEAAAVLGEPVAAVRTAPEHELEAELEGVDHE
ncbi:MAG TPA: glycosyltransferase [Nocardioides sp.]|nr:glycosyltransferase [Nocardioides sp.]